MQLSCAQRLATATRQATPRGVVNVPVSHPCPRAQRAVPVSSSSRGHTATEVQQYAASSRRSALNRVQARAAGATATAQPTPVVKIDNMHDTFATVVHVDYGDKIGEMLETITALKNLGLNIRRAKLAQKGSGETSQNTFYITESDTSEKVVKSARLEEIRMTVLNSLMASYPESAQALSTGKPVETDMSKPLGQRRSVVPTTIDVQESPNGASSILKITTRDRPGLLVDIVRVLKDINLNVVSAEVDTVGREARDEFFVTYHGEPLSPPMVLLVTNALQYYLSLNEVAKEESY